MTGGLLRLRQIQREVQFLTHTAAVLSWDQETYMPACAVAERAEQLALLEGLVHDRTTAPEIGEILVSLGAAPQAPAGTVALEREDRALVRESYRWHQRACRLPRELVTRLARETSLAQACWVESRRRSDYERFRPNLEVLVGLNREKAALLGFQEHPYDALLDEYEPWMRTAVVSGLFAQLEDRLRRLLDRIRGCPRSIEPLSGSFPPDRQRALCETVLGELGFDRDRGRLDVSAHPFSTTLGANDIRLTTRFDEAHLAGALFGTIHEAGHGMYEQGIDPSLDGTILAAGASLGIHESQSRFWENIVGRSLPFSRRYLPRLCALFPEPLSGWDAEALHRAVNKVEATHIRVEADEVTYNLHIILRFNLEVRLIAGELEPKDLPAAWREESVRLLGIEPARDSEGVLQDIHWSMGAMGYFPTYALGNLYAAQFAAAMREDLPDFDVLVAAGSFVDLLQWLRERIHRHGKVYNATDLCERVTGSPLSIDPFVRYLEGKFAAVYGL